MPPAQPAPPPEDEDDDLFDRIPPAALLARGLTRPAEPAPKRPTALLAELFGEYRIAGELSHGGFGIVYRAEHRKLKRRMALKILSHTLTSNAAAVARFEREIEAVGKLDHPGIVRAFDAGERGGVWFLAMEFIEGMDLARLTKTLGPLAPADAAEIARQAALALHNAHGHGLIHRDVKPSNIMLALPPPDSSPLSLPSQPTVKVLDFGLAQLSSADPAGLTISADFLGTVEYIAPEQVENPRVADPRSDLYGLGATLHRLLTGLAPHEQPESRETLQQKLTHVAHDDVAPVRTRRAEIPEGLAALVDSLLQRDPARRPQSAAALAEALTPFCEGADPAALAARVAAASPPLEWPAPGKTVNLQRRRLLRTLLPAAAAAAVLVSLTWWWRGADAPPSAGPGNPPTPPARANGSLSIHEPGWRLAQTIKTTEHVRFARFDASGHVVTSDGQSGVERIAPDGSRGMLIAGNFYNGILLPGAEPTLMLTIHGPPRVATWTQDAGLREVAVDFGPLGHPAALMAVPQGWNGGLDLRPGDAILATGSEKAPHRVLHLRAGAPPAVLLEDSDAPAGLFDAASTNDALYFTRTGSYLGNPALDGILRLDSAGAHLVELSPPLPQMVPGTRGSMSIACDRASGDLFLAVRAVHRDTADHPATVWRLRRGDAAGTRFTATLLVDGLLYTARTALDLSPDGRRLSIVDDKAQRVYVLAAPDAPGAPDGPAAQFSQPDFVQRMGVPEGGVCRMVRSDIWIPWWGDRLSGSAWTAWAHRDMPQEQGAPAERWLLQSRTDGVRAQHMSTRVDLTLASVPDVFTFSGDGRHVLWTENAGPGILHAAPFVLHEVPELSEPGRFTLPLPPDTVVRAIVAPPPDWKGPPDISTSHLLVLDSAGGIHLCSIENRIGVMAQWPAPPGGLPVDAAFSPRGLFLLVPPAERTDFTPVPADTNARLYRRDGSSWTACTTDLPLTDPCALAADPRPEKNGELLVLCGHLQPADAPGERRFLARFIPDGTDRYRVEIIAENFIAPAPGGLEISPDGARLVVADKGAKVWYGWRTPDASPGW